jgi:uncharacterized membrane protein
VPRDASERERQAVAWAELAVAFGVFFLSHSLPIRPPLRPRLQALLGPRGFGVAYSILSLGVLAWLIGAAGRAPYVPLWPSAVWQSHLALVAMGAVCLILALSLGRPNPFSFGGSGAARFDPHRPGLVRWIRHPVLLALAIWAAAHLLANGDLAHGLLFGTFLVFALLGRRLVDRRKQRELGPDWARLWDATRQAAHPLRDLAGAEGALRLVLALVVYAALLWAHPLLFGVSPLR